jgi:hypothetical protein
MTYSNYPNEKEALDKLSLSYRDTFVVLNASENQGRFSKQEKKSFKYIQDKNNHRYRIDHRFALAVWEIDSPHGMNLGFEFCGTPKEIHENSKDTINFCSAHEIKHASLAYNHHRGMINIHSLVLLTQKMFKGLGTITRDKPIFSFICQPLIYGASIAYAASLRKEEIICDKFSLRVFPDADLDLHNNYLENIEKEARVIIGENTNSENILNANIILNEEKKLNIVQKWVKNFQDTLGSLKHTHPENEFRHSCLIKMQNKLKSGNEF